MSTVTVIPTVEQMTSVARAKTVEVLKDMPVYHSMSLTDQKSIYLDMVEQNLEKEKRRYGIPMAKSMATDSGSQMGYKGYDPSLGGETKAFEELVDSVDFPKFVADLMKAVFDANLSVMKTQTDSYIKLMKEATKSTADFIKQIKDDESFATLAETKSDMYNVDMEDQGDGSSKMVLTNPSGEKLNPEDTAVKKAIMETKIAMAKEHRAALREVLLMGVTRLVVDKGEIEAGVEFSVTAKRESKAHHDDKNTNINSVQAKFGSIGWGATVSNTNINVQVNSSDKKATSDMSAKLKGSVKIVFKTDYFKLDNFATMYSDAGTAALKPGGAPAGPVPGAK
ncbi:MAG: hypothetical protein EOO05_12330 [Chitinophagaceae bacterium]|nr:MAG: hypothetical protein EOO05_12330 [Chitinophagaceae bacterium]